MIIRRMQGQGEWACRTIVLAVATPLVAIACSASAEMLLINNDGEFMEYAGTTTLAGVYFTDPSNIEIQDFVCFLPDSDSQRRLPQDSDVNPVHWMCFSNSAEARELLGLKEFSHSDSKCLRGSAEVTVGNYRRYVAESEGVSLSELIDVHQHSEASALPCDVVRSP